MFSKVFFEISGFCNAKCPWCSTGNGSLSSTLPSRLIEPANFEKGIRRLYELKLIEPETIIFPFSRGEPLLHPDFNEILKIFKRLNIPFAISTNASKVVTVESGLLTNMRRFVISMPGFSQASYDRIHGFKFERIVDNIDQLLAYFKEAGFQGPVHLSYHIYQFNIGEIYAAEKFCMQRQIQFLPRGAFPQDLTVLKAYIENTLNYEELRKMSEDLLLFYVKDCIASSPQNYACPQHFNYLGVDECCQVLTCCAIPKGHPNYSIGNLFELSAEEIYKRKRSQAICKECLDAGAAYWTHHPLKPDFIHDLGVMRSYKADVLSFVQKHPFEFFQRKFKKFVKKPRKYLKKLVTKNG